ncbi:MULTISPECIES: hypothetical protein [unclassified Methylobacterium]|uniref:hypothetical protein n=1 Tax=unclassified Methylobacterium TaxID=2615210 RepID=UPI001354A32C|nr:hypothetical protein [Methylobacterium sp. 2A]MWV23505.1 hypothetical protein [Methylobacterium sp. 2A]
MSDETSFGFGDIQPKRVRREAEDVAAVDRIADELGFVSRETTTIQRKAKQGPSGPAGQFNLRAAVADVNEFVDWCGRERMSYREGFGRLMEMKRKAERS